MCLKEAVTNVVKHSKAKNCSITIQSTTDSLRFIVKDDGIGLNNKNENGNGLKAWRNDFLLLMAFLLLSHQKERA